MVEAVTPGVYEVEVMLNAEACNFMDIVTITVLDFTAPEFMVADDGQICNGESTEIGADPVAGNTYMWTSVPEGEVIAAEGFERIHRTNLVGMGVLPLEFKAGTTRHTLELDGTETYDVVGKYAAGATINLKITRKNGQQLEVPMTCRLDTAEEVRVYEAGGVLQRFAQDFLESTVG